MADRFGQAAQLAGNVMRVGWYTGINWIAGRESARHGGQSTYRPTRSVPSRQQLMDDMRELMRRDAELVRDGFAVADGADPAGGVVEHLARLGDMLRDVPEAVTRRQTHNAGTVAPLAEAADVPDYFAQDFHFQKGGYLAEESARLYDVQVETLFYGSAAAMRRAALRPIGEFLAGRDQRQLRLLDVACGTGRLLREIRLVYPALRLAGLDLSPAYLGEASRHLTGLRPARLIAANAEAMPVETASQDIVTSVFLFHELPPEVRRTVAGEMARVLKPGGLLVFVDSLQMGDVPDYDGMLEAFPHRFHEPYFRHYAIDDLDEVFDAAGLAPVASFSAFLSKVMVRRRA